MSMSDTRERSIAEIIGWRWHDRMRAFVPPDGDNGLDSYTRPITVDDMLTWLNDQGYAVEVHAARNEGDRDIWGTLTRYGTTDEVEFSGRSFAEALKLAVRQVAAAE